MQNILVAYSTWAGATRSVGEKIAEVIRNMGFQVVLKKAKDVQSIADYSVVILGSSIQMGGTTKDFKLFLKKFYKELVNKDLALFVVCFNMIEESEENKTETLNWLKLATDKFPELNPLSIGLFSGASVTNSVEFKTQNFLVKKLILMMKTNMESQKGKSDFRNWDAIQKWTVSSIEKITEKI